MTKTIRIELTTELAVATCTGSLRLADALEGARALWGTPGWLGQPVVWDFREAEFDLSSSDIREVAQFVLGTQPSSRPPRVAFVTGRDVDFGLARIFEVHRTDPHTEFRVFRDYDAAARWARDHEPEDA